MALSFAQYEALHTLADAKPEDLEGVESFSNSLKEAISILKVSREAVADSFKSSRQELESRYGNYLAIISKRRKPQKLSPEIARARILHALEILKNSDLFPVNEKSISPISNENFSELLQVVQDEFQSRGIIVELLPTLFGTPLPEEIISLLIKLRESSDASVELTEEERGYLEIMRLAEKMEADYRKELDRLEFYELVDESSKIPTFAQIMATFTPEMLRNVIEHKFQEPKLVLIPPNIPLWSKEKTAKSLKEAIDAHRTMEGQKETWIYDQIYDDSSSEQWQAFMVEGATIMPPLKTKQFTDDIDAILQNRLDAFDQAYENTSIQGVDRFGYAHLMMAGLMAGQPIDARIRRDEEGNPIRDEDGNLTYDRNSTLLNKDKICKEVPLMSVPYVFWDPSSRLVFFSWVLPVHPYDRARFRRSVGGDVPNS